MVTKVATMSDGSNDHEVTTHKPCCSKTIRAAQKAAIRKRTHVKKRPPTPRFNAIPGYLGSN